MQQKVREGDLQVEKVPGAENPADLLTKHLDELTMKKHLVKLSFGLKQDRAVTAPTLNMVREGASDARNKGEPHEDAWLVEGETATRHHERMRRTLFTPLRAEGAPPARALSPMRLTEGRFKDGTPFRHIDCWTTRSTAHSELKLPWTGTTTFYLKSDDEESRKVEQRS